MTRFSRAPLRAVLVLFCWYRLVGAAEDVRTLEQIRKDAASGRSAPSPSDGASRLQLQPAQPASRPRCPNPLAVDLFKHEIAYQRTEARYPLKGIQEIHADVWERGHLTAFYVREQLKDFVPTARMVYPVSNGEIRGNYTCQSEQNWKECVETNAGTEALSYLPQVCAVTVDLRAVPPWTPSPNDQTKQRIADGLRQEIETKWPGALEIVVRDFNLMDNQITIYLRMPDGDYYQGCGFHAMGETHCEGWHLFGQAPVASIRKWIFERPLRLK